MLSALLMTDHLLNKVILPPTWLLIWFSPMLGFLIKVRVVETQHFPEHDLCVAGFSFYRWKRLVSPGLWSVDCINGRFRLNRITRWGFVNGMVASHLLCHSGTINRHSLNGALLS
jgi:hypothetical protein